MKNQSIEKKVRGLIGNYLVPNSLLLERLKFEFDDLLMFKEWIDIEFGDIFELEKLTEMKTVEELIHYITRTVKASGGNNQSGPINFKFHKEEQPPKDTGLPDDIGFL